MPRNIKRVAHDLLPLSDVTVELSSIIAQLLHTITSYVHFDDKKASKYFNECINASEKLAVSVKLIRKYVEDVNAEADREGITKD